jgi:hypothetical protein
MQLNFLCPKCGRPCSQDVHVAGDRLECPCGWGKLVVADDLAQGDPARCLGCGNADLWRQKDFPAAWGLAAVAVQVVVSTVFWAWRRPVWTYAVLLAFAVLDLVLYVVLPDVLVCYRCRARHRRPIRPGLHPTFDHGTAERYRQEQLRATGGG